MGYLMVKGSVNGQKVAIKVKKGNNGGKVAKRIGKNGQKICFLMVKVA